MKKVFSFILFFLLITSYVDAQYGWILQPSGTNAGFKSVSFVNANTGTIVGNGAVVHRTTNGGTNWFSQNSGLPNGYDFYCVSFVNTENGILVGSVGTILRTTNGGSNWIQQPSGTTNILYGVSYINENIATIVGQAGTILRTTDGGANWIAQSSGTSFWLSSVCFINQNTGTIVGGGLDGSIYRGIILRTTNGGTNWNTQSGISTNVLSSVSFVNENTGTAVGGFYNGVNYTSEIIRTTNGGTNWGFQASSVNSKLHCVSFADEYNGTAVGVDNNSHAVIIRTTNGGTTWFSQMGGTSIYLFGVDFIDANTGTAVGGNGTIFKTTNGGMPPPDVGVSSISNLLSGKIINANGTDLIAYVKNFGATLVSNIDVYYKLNGGAAIGPVMVTGPLSNGDSAMVTFTGANQLTSMSDLTGTVKVYTDYPGDSNVSNDTLSVSNVFLRVPPSSFPYFSDFSESPSPYTLSGSANLWGLVVATNPGGTLSDPAARANFWGVASGFQILRSTLVDLTGTTNPLLSFYRAYRTYSGENDQLQVLVSTNGGMTWSAPLYQRGWTSVPSLGTLPASTLSPFTPSDANHWMHNLVDLSTYAGQEVVVGFNAISAWGNNLWIDNIKISDPENISLIPVNAPGTYGSLDTNGIQVNFTALRPGLGSGSSISQTDNLELWTPENTETSVLQHSLIRETQTEKDVSVNSRVTNSGISPDASEGVLALTRVDDFPINNVFQTNLTATTYNGAIYTPDVIADRYWEVAYSGNDYVSTATYDIILDISIQQGITAFDSLYIVKRVDQNSPWVCLNTITDYEMGVPVRLISTGLTGFSQFGIASADGTLPVDLVEFNATVDRNSVTLNWTTAWEENNMRFDVQRRPVILPATMGSGSEESIWATVGSVTGSGTTQEQKSYSFLDRNLVTGKYEYRLVQVDFDGNSTADHSLSSHVEIGIPNEFVLSQNYPNPFNPTTKINFQIPVEGFVKLAFYDISGREVATLVNEFLTPGYFVLEFNGTGFASGIYFYRLISSNSVITKRAVLVK